MINHWKQNRASLFKSIPYLLLSNLSNCLVCMYVFMYVCMYVYMYVCIYVCIYKIYKYAYIHNFGSVWLKTAETDDVVKAKF